MTGKDHGDKRGRPRRYDFRSDETCRDAVVGFAISTLNELLERVADQIVDLPPEAFSYSSPGSWFCLGWLPLHLAWAENHQMMRIAGGLGIPQPHLDDDIETRLSHGALQSDGTVPAELQDASVLIDMMHTVRDSVSIPVCRLIDDATRVIPKADRLSTAQAVLMHQFWHWTYHSGHIGLMRLEWGSDYEWVMSPAPFS